MQLAVIDDWAQRHFGVISRVEAARLGVTTGSWYRAIERGDLELLHPNVARTWGSPRGPLQSIRAAVLAAGPRSMASHRSAARLWGIERPDRDPVDVIVPRACRQHLVGVAVHRPIDVADLQPSDRSGIRCTNLLRTLLDLGAVDPGSVRDAVRSAVVSGVVSPRVLRALLERHARPGRAGTGPLRRVLADWPIEGKPPDSLLELEMADLLRAHRLPPAEFHPLVGSYELDFRLIGTPIILECDGWEFHGVSREQFEATAERDAALGAAGHVVFHFTWRMITRRAANTARRIRALLAQWAPDVLAAHDGAAA